MHASFDGQCLTTCAAASRSCMYVVFIIFRHSIILLYLINLFVIVGGIDLVEHRHWKCPEANIVGPDTVHFMNLANGFIARWDISVANC